jgi:hypothetical protein
MVELDLLRRREPLLAFGMHARRERLMDLLGASRIEDAVVDGVEDARLEGVVGWLETHFW